MAYDNILNNSEIKINNFYDNGSIALNNKFHVGLYGDYVKEALDILSNSTVTDPFLNISKTQLQRQTRVFKKTLDTWLTIYASKEGKREVELFWNCESIKLPNVSSTIIDSKISIDATKPIQYALTKSYGGAKDVTLSIVDDKTMLMYQFFNELHNRFYNAQTLTPRSSFHKLGLYCAILQTAIIDTLPDINNNNTRNYSTDFIPVQVYEFNSAVITNVSDISLTNKEAGLITFTVTIKVPNTFQEPFKTTVRGLRDISRLKYPQTTLTDNNKLSYTDFEDNQFTY